MRRAKNVPTRIMLGALLLLLAAAAPGMAKGTLPDRTDAPAGYWQGQALPCEGVYLGQSITPDERVLAAGEDDPTDDGLVELDIEQGWLKVRLPPGARQEGVFFNAFFDWLADGDFQPYDWIIQNVPLKRIALDEQGIARFSFPPQGSLFPALASVLRLVIGAPIDPALINQRARVIVLACGEFEDYLLPAQSAAQPEPPTGGQDEPGADQGTDGETAGDGGDQGEGPPADNGQGDNGDDNQGDDGEADHGDDDGGQQDEDGQGKDKDKDKDKDHQDAGQGNGDEEGDPGNSGDKNKGGDEDSSNPGHDKNECHGKDCPDDDD